MYEDMTKINLGLSDEEISQFTKIDFKVIVKTKMRKHVLDELNSIKIGHSKVMLIKHGDMKYPQKYLMHSKFSNKQSSLLFNLRCKSQNKFSSNFASSTLVIPCKICKKYEDTQEHAIHCEKLKMHMTQEHRQLLENSSYSDLFSDINDQLRITEAFQIIIETRERLQDTSRTGLPGLCTGPRDL